MLDHHWQTPGKPERVVILGRRGFVAGAVVERLEGQAVETLALGSDEVDLLASDAVDALAGRLMETDALVVVSAIAPCKDIRALIDNLTMMRAACETIGRVRPAHTLYISSDAVYADEVNPVRENSCAAPASLHGMMHAARELMLKTAVAGAPLCILRPSLLYGAADPHDGYGPNRFRRVVADGKAVVLFGEGEEKRDHVLIDDLAEIVHLCLAHRSAGVLNVATGTSASFREVAERVAGLFEGAAPVEGTPRQNPITHRHFDITACRKAFPGFRYTTLAEGFAKAHRDASGGR